MASLSGLYGFAELRADEGAEADDRLAFEKVDPPSWWKGSTLSPVRLLIQGQGLYPGTTIRTESPYLTVYNYRSSENGHYLFADLKIHPDCKAGTYTFSLEHRNGERVAFPFTVQHKPTHRPRGFSSDDFIYFVMPDRFCDGDPSNNAPAKSAITFDRSKPRHYHGGDFAGLTSKLPYIQSLGTTAIWTTPVYDNNDGLDYKEAYPNSDGVKEPTTGYHGYGAIDMYAVDEHLGKMEDLQSFVRSAHQLGLKVIQDQVANHTGPYHVWAEDPPTPTWWNGTVDNHTANNWQKWTAMNPRSTDDVRSLNLDGWFLDILPDFNQDDPEVARYLIQNSLWWIANAQFDAVRMDTLPHVPRSYWNQWTAALKKEFPGVVILGELFDSDPVLLSYYQGGRPGHDGVDTQIDSLFDFGLFTPIRKVFAQGKSIRELHQMFGRDWLYPDANRLTTFVGVHDMQRFMNDEGATTAGLRMALTLIATSRGTPLIYYGDEIAMPGGGDPDNRRDFPGGFPGDARNAFTAEGRTAIENDVWNHVARLGQLRKDHEVLRRGKSLDLLDAEQQYAYARLLDRDCMIIVFNNDVSPAVAKFPLEGLSIEPISQGWSFQCDDMLGVAPPLVIEDGVASVTLPERTAAIYRMPKK
ncbi:MAG: alpha-amylase family glycosyl hydrolase [Pirellula sp.]|nr:alpha-amylase family glycosyl hydrolase [Pirellula sp.]